MFFTVTLKELSIHRVHVGTRITNLCLSLHILIVNYCCIGWFYLGLTWFCWQDWYMVAKVIAEKTALEYAEKNGLNVVTVCPTMALGPLLRPMVNVSHEFLLYIIKGCIIFVVIFCYFLLVIRIITDIKFSCYLLEKLVAFSNNQLYLAGVFLARITVY